MPKFITYTGNDEILITTKNTESVFLKDYFTNGSRDLDEYERNEIKDSGMIVSSSIDIC